MKRRKLLTGLGIGAAFLVCILIGLFGCGGEPSPTATSTPAPTETPVPPTFVPTRASPTPTPIPRTATAAPVATTPTPSPTSIPTATSALSPTVAVPEQELREKWRTPLYAIALTVACYEGLLDTADRVQAEEIDGPAAFGELLALGIILKSTEESLAEWEPAPNQMEYKSAIQSHIDVAKIVMTQWVDREISSANVRGLVEGDYQASQDTLQGIARAMQDDGLSPDDIQAMMDDLVESMQELLEEMETP